MHTPFVKEGGMHSRIAHLLHIRLDKERVSQEDNFLIIGVACRVPSTQAVAYSVPAKTRAFEGECFKALASLHVCTTRNIRDVGCFNALSEHLRTHSKAGRQDELYLSIRAIPCLRRMSYPVYRSPSTCTTSEYLPS